jgi:hypothetical protein
MGGIGGIQVLSGANESLMALAAARLPETVEGFVMRLGKMYDLVDITDELSALTKDVSVMGGGATIGEVHRWQDGKLYKKTPDGWMPYDHKGQAVSDQEWGGHSAPQFHEDDVADSGAGRDFGRDLTLGAPNFEDGIRGTSQRIEHISKILEDYIEMSPRADRAAAEQKAKTILAKVMDFVKNLLKSVFGDKAQELDGGRLAIAGKLNPVDLRNLATVVPQINRHLDDHINRGRAVRSRGKT